MKASTLFKTFNYSIVPNAILTSNCLTCTQQINKGAPLVNVAIDFEHENFRLEGDWQYMMASNKHAEKKWFGCHDQRVSIEASIYPGLAIDLSDERNDGMVFIIEGVIKDKANIGTCSGLLVLDKMTTDNETAGNKWDISFYLYDSAHDDCEIAFRFPVYGRSAKQLLN